MCKVKNKVGQTPLHLAAKAGHIEVAKKLVEAGSKADARDKVGWWYEFRSTTSVLMSHY